MTGRAKSAAMYKCRELRDSIDWLGAALGPLSDRELAESGNVALSVDEIERVVRRLNAMREQIATKHGFADEMETPEIVSRLRR